MPTARYTTAERDSRVLVFSQRTLHQPTWQALQYTFEDLLTLLDDVRVIAPPALGPRAVSGASRRLANGVRHRTGRGRKSPPSVFPSMRPTVVRTNHDLFFTVIHDPWQLSYLRRLQGWRERCRRSACLIIEIWSGEVQEDADYLEVLREFDSVYVFNSAAIPAMTEIGLPAPRFLPVGVDTIAFSPLPLLPRRSIDCYSYGRTSPGVHAQLLDLVEREGLTYLYDTLSSPTVQHPQEHRALLANMMKRSRYFLAHRINDSPERRQRTGGDESLSTRYFEGAAGGAVLLGSAPHTDDFRACFDWEDAVIPLPYDSPLVRETLSELESQPDRIAGARANNVRNSLLRHDWVHRWERVLSDSDLSGTTQMRDRRARLQALAEAVRPEVLATAAGPR